MARPRVLVISADAVGRTMAGTGIRAYEIARALSDHADVTLASVESGDEPVDDMRHVTFHVRDATAIRPHVMAADAVFAQPQWPVVHHWMRASGARLIFDLYNVEPFEVLEFLRDRSITLRRVVGTLTIDRVLAALHDGHHFVCASDKQRDLWLGTMMAERLIDTRLYDRDPTLLSRLDLAPFGVPAEPPHRPVETEAARARFPAIGPEDEIVLWNGGIWSWLDAPTAVRAVVRLAARRPGVRLVFMGAATHGPAQVATAEARHVAAELGALNRTVFFNDRWVPYERRADWLLEAACAISTHVEHLETRFAFRTRLLDCFWAGLPVVCTEGDDLAARVERDGLGRAVPPQAPEAVAAAIEDVLARGREHYAERLARAAKSFAWPRVTAPLARWIAESELPPRLGAGVPWHPSHAARHHGYRLARTVLNRTGLRDWPRL